MVASVGDEETDVAQQRGGLEVLAVRLVQMVQVAAGVVQLEREGGGVLEVLTLVGTDVGQMADALVAEIAEVVERRVLRALQGVEEDALSQREVRHDHALDAQLRECLLQQDHSADDDVGPLRIEAVDLEELLHRAGLRDRLDDIGQLGSGELEVAQHSDRFAAALRLDHLRDVEDRARAAHHHLVAPPRELARDRAKVGAHELATFVDTAAAHGLATEEPLGEADGAELEAACVEHPPRTTEHELGAAPSDVDQQHLLVEHRHCLQHAQMNEPCLLHARDHLDLDARLGARPVEEDIPVLRLPHRARRHRVDGRAGDIRDLAEALEGLDATGDGRGLEHLHVARPRAQAHHLLLPVDHLEAVPAERAGDEQMDGVGADVDGGQGGVLSRHAERPRPPRRTCPGTLPQLRAVSSPTTTSSGPLPAPDPRGSPGEATFRPAMRTLRVDESRQAGIVATPARCPLTPRLQPDDLGVTLLETRGRAIRGPDLAVGLQMEQGPCRKAVAEEALHQLGAQLDKGGLLARRVVEPLRQTAAAFAIGTAHQRHEPEHRRRLRFAIAHGCI